MHDLIVTTLSHYSEKLFDNVLKSNAFLNTLKTKGNIKLLDGGSFIEEDLMYAENSTFKFYSGYEELDVSHNPVLTSAKFEWKQANANVVISGLETRQNASSKTRKHDLLAAKIQVAEKTMQNNIAESLFGDGTEHDGKGITGLSALIADDPTTGIVGGIDRAQNIFWRNQVYSFEEEQDIAPEAELTPEQFLMAMDELFIRCTRGKDLPKMIIMDKKFYGMYKAVLHKIKRIIGDDTKGDAGFRHTEYEGVPVFYDACAKESHAYFINTDYLSFKVHKDANFKLDKERLPYNQDAGIYPMIFMGNLTISNCELQGVLIR